MMEIDFFSNDCAEIRNYVLTEYNSAKLRMVNHIAGLEAMLHDTEVMYKAFSNPAGACYNVDAAIDYKNLLTDLMGEWVAVSQAIKLLDDLKAEMDQLTCGESGNLLLAVKLKWDLETVLKTLELCYNANISRLKNRGAILRSQWSRDCMGIGKPEEIYEEEDLQNPDCVIKKGSFHDYIYGQGGLVDQWNKMYSEQCERREASRVGLVNYCAVEGNRECAANYCAMVKQNMDWFKIHAAAYREKLDAALTMLDSIHCGSGTWPEAVAATADAINELQDVMNAAASDAATNKLGLESLQGMCPLPGMRPD
jgi:hypothetical protein